LKKTVQFKLVFSLLSFNAGLPLYAKVNQSPPSIFGVSNNLPIISCEHSITSYYVILWYQRPVGDSALNLIGYISYDKPDIEKTFTHYFNITGNGASKSQLHVLKLRKPEDTGTYYCVPTALTGIRTCPGGEPWGSTPMTETLPLGQSATIFTVLLLNYFEPHYATFVCLHL
uniref:Ig-like domain-containing protein n=1 Tax=Cynoglossus semilaevis TaxID=244447 RepID=A0A3P8VNU7_CYNSE